MNNSVGYIYILTNPSFPEYVKIGYADDVNRRLKELNRSECIPYAFRIYATYEVNSRLSDKKIHNIIDKLNPELRSIENYQGKERVREFYAMSAEDAYSILEAMAEIHGCESKLIKWKMTKEQEFEEMVSEEIEELHQERMKPFKFSMCNINVGESIEFSCHTNPNHGAKCIVVNDKQVEYENQLWSLTGLAKYLTKAKYSIPGPAFFKYNGELLNDLRARMAGDSNE